jgi:hypothetical protein
VNTLARFAISGLFIVAFWVLIGAARKLPQGESLFEFKLGDVATVAAFFCAYWSGLILRTPR